MRVEAPAKARFGRVAGRGLGVSLVADEPCTITLRARARGVASFRTRSVKVQGGVRTTVRLSLRSSALRRLRATLRRRTSVLVRVTAAGIDGAGNRSAQAKRIRLRRPR